MSSKPLISFDEIAGNSKFFLDPDDRPDWQGVFGNDHPLVLEIGFGNGGFMLELAVREPRINFIGVEMFHKGIRKVITRIDKLRLGNVRVVYGDAREKIPHIFRDGELNGVFINFPDPWPKKRHTKRRMITREFACALADKLQPGAAVSLATDSPIYAETMLESFSAAGRLRNKAGEGQFAAARPAGMPQSKYEKNFIQAGERIFYLDFVRQ